MNDNKVKISELNDNENDIPTVSTNFTFFISQLKMSTTSFVHMRTELHRVRGNKKLYCYQNQCSLSLIHLLVFIYHQKC